MILSFALATALLADASQHRIAGPTIACGAAFVIELRAGEALEWRDTGMDFVAYRFHQGKQVTVIYEGNHPQRGGIVHNTGLNAPAKVVVHGGKNVASRVRFDRKLRGRCPKDTPRW